MPWAAAVVAENFRPPVAVLVAELAAREMSVMYFPVYAMFLPADIAGKY